MALAHVLSAVFAAVALLHAAAPRPLVTVYRRQHFFAGLPVVIAALCAAIAVLLASPDARLWGTALAVPAMFVAVVVLLGHRQYWLALSAIGLIVALFRVVLTAGLEVDLTRYQTATALMQ